LGETDTTPLLDWHVELIKSETPIFVPDHKVLQSLMWSEDAGRFLAWIGDQQYCGPINAASNPPIAIGEFAAMVATELTTEVVYSETLSKTNLSPFGFTEETTLAIDLAERLGFRFTGISDWLPIVIRQQINNGPRRSRDPGLNAILRKLHHHVDVTADELDYLRRAVVLMQRQVREQ
jgi:hypothetical protein